MSTREHSSMPRCTEPGFATSEHGIVEPARQGRRALPVYNVVSLNAW